MRVALHSCCGPCSIEVVDFHRDGGEEPTLVYANPNIQPRAEYELRRDTAARYADVVGAGFVEVEGGEDTWEREVAVFGADRSRRCRACYRVRFEAVARWARENGFDAVATTLSISPYQDADAIRDELEAAAARHGVRARFVDHRERYREATRRSREAGMYRQNYCGCRFSRVEADREREERRSRRREARS